MCVCVCVRAGAGDWYTTLMCPQRRPRRRSREWEAKEAGHGAEYAVASGA